MASLRKRKQEQLRWYIVTAMKSFMLQKRVLSAEDSGWKIYQKYQKENKTEILMNHPDIPRRPSQTVDSDFFYLKERQHLLMKIIYLKILN